MKQARILVACFFLSFAAFGVANGQSETNDKMAPPTIMTTTTTKSHDVTSTRHRLREHLLKGYASKHVHPVKNHSEAVPLQLGIEVKHLDIDEAKSVFHILGWMRLLWYDQFLMWNPEDFDGIKMMTFGADEIWKPDIMLYNSADLTTIHFPPTHIVVQSDGGVLWVPPAHLKAYCQLDMRHWPVDKQTCSLQFGSWTSNGDIIALSLYPSNHVEKWLVPVRPFIENREWHLYKPSPDKNSTEARLGVKKYPGHEEEYHNITFTFNLERDSPAYRSVIILPCLVLMLATLCSFLLNPESGEKLIVSGMALIGTILYLIYFASTLSFHQSSVPIIVSFYSTTCGLIGIAILLNVICINMARGTKHKNPPKFLMRMFSGFLGKCLYLGNYSHQVSTTHQRLNVELSSVDNGRVDSNRDDGSLTELQTQTLAGGTKAKELRILQDWIMVTAGLERLFFIVYSLAFAVVLTIIHA